MKNVRLVVAVFCALFAQNLAAQTKPVSADALIGLWGSEEIYGPTVRGDLVIDARQPEWRAQIGGYQIVFRPEAIKLDFKLPADAGEFRGQLSSDRKTLTGHWIQPGGPWPFNNRYATPLEFTAIAPNAWKGTVVPLDQRISLYLQIDKAADGKLIAFIRNPEGNMVRGQTFEVELRNTTVHFSNQNGGADGTYDHDANTISIALLDGRPPVMFTRRDRNSAVGFYARTPEARTSYVYRQPLAQNDGWAVGSLKDAGLDPKPLAELIDRIVTTQPSLVNPVDLHSLLIARHGKLVLEEYFYGYDENRPHDLRSAGKTYSSALVGIAQDQGFKLAPETPVYPLFAQYKPIANWDDRKSKLTIRDLLTMTSGYFCDDGNPKAPGNEDVMQNQSEQPDWYKYTLDLPMASDPGGDQAIYCSVDSNLAMGAVRQATGKWIPDFFYENLARPLQMRNYYLNLMPTGEAYGAGGMQIRPRDELKLGQLYLSGGLWNGHRVISAQWVKESLSVRSHFQPRMASDTDHAYGYAWHSRPHEFAGHTIRDFYAAGNGGQYIIVLPDLDMVVVMNGGDYSESKKFFPFESDLLQRYIIAAVDPAR